MREPLAASTLSPEETALWQCVKDLWALSVRKDHERIRAALHPAYAGWDMSAPLPHDREAAVQSACGGSSRLIQYELEPLSVRLYEGCAGVVHYRYRATLAPRGGIQAHLSGNWTEVYVKQGARWLMAAVSGRPEA